MRANFKLHNHLSSCCKTANYHYMSKQPFEKFINPKVTGAKKKEVIKQEKKKAKAEVRADLEEERKRNEVKYGVVTKTTKQQNTGDKAEDTGYSIQHTRNRIQDTRFKRNDDRGIKKQDTGNKIKDTRFRKEEGGNKKQYTRDIKPGTGDKPTRGGDERKQYMREGAPAEKRMLRDSPPARYVKGARTADETSVKGKLATPYTAAVSSDEPMPLNKYVAHAGISGRREAAILVKEGKVKVNGDIVYEPGYKVSVRDKVEVKDKLIFLQKNLVYILINKPKDYITTAKDPEGRKTVFELVAHATKERIYPVGRLDRNTTGVLLMTNDGELAQKLTHPSFEIKKIYEVKLDKPLTKKDADAIVNGLTLEDGFIKADSVAYADAKDKSIIGIEIHSGRNRIVRRLFEFLGYDVKNLDRVMFANLTKKNVDRGKWRFLNDKEIRLLKYMNQSFVRNAKSE